MKKKAERIGKPTNMEIEIKLYETLVLSPVPEENFKTKGYFYRKKVLEIKYD